MHHNSIFNQQRIEHEKRGIVETGYYCLPIKLNVMKGFR